MTACNTKQTFFYGLMLVLIAFILTIVLYQPVVINDESKKNIRSVSSKMLKTDHQNVVKVRQAVQKKDKKIIVKLQKKTRKKIKQLSVARSNALKTGKKIQSQSNVPRLIGEFKLPINDFFRQVEKNGAKLVVYDRGKSKIVGQIVNNKWLYRVNTHGMSARTRQITKDLPLSVKNKYNQLILKHYGTGVMEYLIMLPMNLDARFWGVLSEILKHQKIDLLQLDVIDFSYLKVKQQIHLLVNNVQIKGEKQSINLSARFL